MSFAAPEPATCARCSFAEPVLAPKTYALALLTGNQDATLLWQLELEKSAQAPIPPLHTFCVKCRQSSWVARRATAQEALAAHLAESALWHEVWHNYYRQKGVHK